MRRLLQGMAQQTFAFGKKTTAHAHRGKTTQCTDVAGIRPQNSAKERLRRLGRIMRQRGACDSQAPVLRIGLAGPRKGGHGFGVSL